MSFHSTLGSRWKVLLIKHPLADQPRYLVSEFSRCRCPQSGAGSCWVCSLFSFVPFSSAVTLRSDLALACSPTCSSHVSVTYALPVPLSPLAQTWITFCLSASSTPCHPTGSSPPKGMTSFPTSCSSKQSSEGPADKIRRVKTFRHLITHC